MGIFQTLGNAIGSAAGGNLLGAATSLFGSLIGSKNNSDTNASNVAMTQETNAMQKAMFDKQLAFNLDMWNKNNEYNTPSQQVQRLKAAGLNPYLYMQGQGGTGLSSSPAAGAQPPNLSAPQVSSFDPSSSFSAAGNMIADASMKRAQVENLREDTKQKAIDNLTRNAENLSRIDKLASDTHTNRAYSDLLAVAHELKRATFDSVVYQSELQNRSLEEQNELTYQTRLGIELDNILKDMRNHYYPQQISAELAHVWSQVKLNRAQTALSYAEQKKLAAETVESVLRANKMRIENKYVDRLSSAMVRSAELQADALDIDTPDPESAAGKYRTFINEWIDPATTTIGKVFGGSGSVSLSRSNSNSRSTVHSTSSSRSFNENHNYSHSSRRKRK